MARLRNRQRSIPFGFKFVVPETRWEAPNFASFDTVVNALIAHRQGNPALCAKHHWSTDRAAVENDVDSFNANMCVAMGWLDYVSMPTGEPPPPKSKPPSPEEAAQVSAAGAKSAKIWSGVKTLNEWYDSKEPAVPTDLSTARAKACSECPFNEQGDYSRWFTTIAAEAIKRQVEKFSERKLTTPYDDKLATCKACLCVNKLSVHAPLKIKMAHMREDVYDELRTAPACWVVKENEA